jgi:hypothetical protein
MPPTLTPTKEQPMPKVDDVRSQNGGTTTFWTSRQLARIKPTIKAADLASTPPPLTTPPPPVQPNIPTNTNLMVQNVARDVNGLITAQTEEAKRAKELATEFGALNNQGSMSDLFMEQRQTLGIDDNMRELKDIQLQLTDIDTGSKLTETRIEGAAGQTLGQAQREVTQEQRENSVRTSGLAARAAVLQGNIQTATQLARDTVNMAFQDRTLKAQNLLNQLNYYQGVTDKQTAQLLEQDKRQYEAELATIKELKDNIANAMVSGATQAEISQLNSPDLDDASKLALAQSITARGSNEMRGLDMEAKRADIAQGWTNIDLRRQELQLSEDKFLAELNQSGNLYGTIDGKPQNQTQALVGGFAGRLLDAEKTLTVVNDMFAGNMAFGSILPNQLKSAERQQFEQAKRNFINAVLRRESGAVIADSEFDNAAQQYFAQPGDSPEALLLKAQNRNRVINNFYQEANMLRPVSAGAVIESDGKKYQVSADGVTLIEL